MFRLPLVAACLFAFTACTAENSAQTDMEDEDMAPAVMAGDGEETAVSADGNAYTEALSGTHRSAENKARDRYRHPAETLAFFGLEPGMTVVEISPGGGWYTEVLAPAIGPQGTLYAAHADPAGSDRAAQSVARFQEKLAASPVYENTQLTTFGKDDSDGVAPAGSADMVLTFRNVHNWYMGNYAEKAFRDFFAALKPGGILGVVEHRLPEDADDERMKSSGYMKRSTVVEMAQAAGFELVAESEINANPNDTADYERGVWTLPPNFAAGDENRERYAAIGESDRMTLKFRKPA